MIFMLKKFEGGSISLWQGLKDKLRQTKCLKPKLATYVVQFDNSQRNFYLN